MLDVGIPNPPKLAPEERAADNIAQERRCIINSYRRQIVESELITKSLKDALTKYVAENPEPSAPT